jgi:hypothetical protein
MAKNSQGEQINQTKELSPIAQLFQLGRDQSYVTFADILRFFPTPEYNLEQLDRIFAALLCAGIPYGEDADHLCCPFSDPKDTDNWY